MIEILTLNQKDVSDFSNARNTLLNKSKSDWVFFLDTDESLSKGLKKEIKSLDLKNFDGYYVKRKNYFVSQYIGEDRIIRLGKKGKGEWKRRVHEIWNIQGKIGELQNPIIHNTSHSVFKMIKKLNFYSTLHAEENLANRNKSTVLKIIFYPLFKLIQSLFMGRGFVFSLLQSFHSFLSWSKEWQLQKD